MQLTEFLDKSNVDYEVREHQPAFSAQTMAAVEHESGKYVAKPVLIKADEEYMMCVLSACDKINLQALQGSLGVKCVELADEKEMARIFKDCELGAEPPF